ncbi:MAG: Peptidyl-tRNA hydrolase [Wolbachia endosymbiont of Ctenocephalides orientis wCori]|nr:MAG: Peptidyl-tRNA hydrolase [Wolbachia endosymbiont of Ctenocephalides orientis wCori]
MDLIVGLGNPGSKYELTYHNIGFLVVDAICKCWNFQPFSKKVDYLITSGFIHDKKVMLLKPYSFMNNSGIPVSKVQNFYKLLLENVIVIHDDADLDLGKIKIKKGGSSGGHNGIKSIDAFISNDYWRLRFGVGRPNDQRSLADHVLSKCSHFEALNSLIEKIAENMPLVLQQDHTAFISKII